MRSAHWWLAIVLVTLLIRVDAVAQGRGRGADNGRGRGGDGGDRGPAFCRSGEGHPRFGWRWCEERGWGRERSASRYPSAARSRFPAGSRYPDARIRNADIALDNGYADGYEKGLDDGRDRREFDPVRHDWYRRGDRGYDSRYGSRAQYQNAYRNGFRTGYEAGYRDGERTERGGVRFPWPF